MSDHDTQKRQSQKWLCLFCVKTAQVFCYSFAHILGRLILSHSCVGIFYTASENHSADFAFHVIPYPEKQKSQYLLDAYPGWPLENPPFVATIDSPSTNFIFVS
jgi:hypothetical protein